MEPTVAHSPILASFLPLLIFTIPAAIFGYILGKQKGRNHVAWTIWGIIPIVNMFAIWYFIGSTNLNVERKLDQLLRS